MLTYQKNPEKENVLAIPESISPEERFQQQRMRDVFLLLENLAAQEEATIKLIIDCLYDVGSIKIINKKIPHPSANKIVKWIAVMSKPIFRVVAWRWVRKNLPEKVTNWLARKISFQ